MAAVLAVIENDLAFIARLRTHFQDLRSWDLRLARSGEEAILYLRGVGVYADRENYPLPLALLLDAQSASDADLQVLGWVRTEKHFAGLPVIIMAEGPAALLAEPLAVDARTVVVPRTGFEPLDKFLISMLVTFDKGDADARRLTAFSFCWPVTRLSLPSPLALGLE